MPIFEFKCRDCGAVSALIVWPGDTSAARCQSCEGHRVDKLISAPGLLRSSSSSAPGQLRSVDARRTVEHMSRSYDAAGIDPGGGFDEVARRAAAGDSPHELKEAVREAKKKEGVKTAGAGGESR